MIRERQSASSVLEWAIGRFGERLAFTTSFQAEGMVILDLAARISRDIRVVTVDTGRLPEETFQMIETVRERYGVKVELVFPDPAEVESMVHRHGPNLFYDSVAMRELCCNVRKVRPLERKLREFDAWVVGLRREQSGQRAGVEKLALVDGRFKISPLADWTREQVWEYIGENEVPVHPLYKRGYTSIGCAPCTRPVEPGEEERAGRWWWERDGAKECGIHFSVNGTARRSLDVMLGELTATTHRGGAAGLSPDTIG
jgi:thioredoxin-dependent adenylylsulfate APS reductase